MDQPNTLPAIADVVIIGAGIQGCASAYYMAKAGMKVVLIDKSRVAGQQSSRAWGFVRVQMRDPDEIPLMQAGKKLWRYQMGAGVCTPPITYRVKGVQYIAVGASGCFLGRQFMTGAAARGYRVDFITLHWYGSDFSAAAVGQLRNYVQAVYNRYHKPIWLTEYALINFGGGQKYPTQAQQAAFVTGSTAMLDALPYVQRYAWFALPSQGDDTGLYRSATSPTPVGVAYRAAK